MKLVLKISILLLTTCLFVQAQYPTTPNLGLTLPPYNTYNWNTLVNTNFSLIDTAVGSLQSIYQGVWSSGVTYLKGQIVSYSGILYISNVNNNLNNIPPSSSSWTLFVQSVYSINSVSGAFTFSGSGVVCTGTTCTFSSASGVTSVSNSDGTLTVSPASGAVVASLALGHANTWTGNQTSAKWIASAGFDIIGATFAGHYLRNNGTDYVDSTIQAGDVPLLNQNTTGTAGGLSGSPAIIVSNLTDSALASGQCVQTTTGGLLTVTGSACGSGSGGISGATLGQPITATSATTGTSNPIYYNAKSQATADITTDLVAQYAVTSNVNQTTQGNGYTGTQTGSVNPFNSFSPTSDIAITTDFGPYTINANAAWTIFGNDVLIRGHGQNGNSVLTLNNGGSFPANTTLLTFGDNTHLPFSDRVENWRINCGTASSTAPCVLMNSGQEGTGFRDTTFIGTNVSSASSPVLQISGTNGSDHGEYRGLSILNTGTGNDAIQFTITTGTNSYEGNIVSRLTGNNTGGAHTGNACIHQVGTSFQSWSYVIGMHCEDFTYGVEVGNNTGIGGIGLEATGTLTDVLHIDTGGVVGGTAVIDIRDNSSSVTNLVNDVPNGRTLTNANYTFAGGHFLAGYFSGTTAFGGMNYQTNSYSSAHTANINELGIVSTAAMTLTIPHALTMQYWHATNESSGTLTLACDTGNINGSATVTMSQYQQADVWADGTNCWAGLPGTGGGSVSLTSSAGTLTLSPSPITGTGTLDINLGNANTWTALQTFGTHISIGGVTASGATGTGNIVFATSPTFITPLLGTPTSGVITNLTGTCTSCNIGGNAATVTTSVSSTNSSFSILSAANTSGSQAPVTVSGFTINPSTGLVTLPAVSASSATFTGAGIPIATGTSSNSDLAGFITLSGGTGTYTFTATYVTAPVCVATDTTATNAVQASTTTTVLTINGTSTDVIAYHCIGRT